MVLWRHLVGSFEGWFRVVKFAVPFFFTASNNVWSMKMQLGCLFDDVLCVSVPSVRYIGLWFTFESRETHMCVIYVKTSPTGKRRFGVGFLKGSFMSLKRYPFGWELRKAAGIVADAYTLRAPAKEVVMEILSFKFDKNDSLYSGFRWLNSSIASKSTRRKNWILLVIFTLMIKSFGVLESK